MNIGAVAGLREIKDAISVAYHVLKYTRHTMLVGEHATEFALMMGFKRENLQTPKSLAIWRDWKDKNCQPNFWTVSQCVCIAKFIHKTLWSSELCYDNLVNFAMPTLSSISVIHPYNQSELCMKFAGNSPSTCNALIDNI